MVAAQRAAAADGPGLDPDLGPGPEIFQLSGRPRYSVPDKFSWMMFGIIMMEILSKTLWTPMLMFLTMELVQNSASPPYVLMVGGFLYLNVVGHRLLR